MLYGLYSIISQLENIESNQNYQNIYVVTLINLHTVTIPTEKNHFRQFTWRISTYLVCKVNIHGEDNFD